MAMIVIAPSQCYGGAMWRFSAELRLVIVGLPAHNGGF